MKHFVLAGVAGIGLCLCACGHHRGQTASNQPDSLSTPRDPTGNAFFPVADYLESEILRVDSFPQALRKYMIQNGKTDSAYIQVPEFNALALQFLPPAIRDGSFEKHYTESSFLDRSSQTITFTYSAADKDLPLQRVDVLATPENGVNQVKSIYMENNKVSGDSVTLQKMYWQAGKEFEVVSLIRIKGKPPVEQQLKVVWDADE